MCREVDDDEVFVVVLVVVVVALLLSIDSMAEVGDRELGSRS